MVDDEKNIIDNKNEEIVEEDINFCMIDEKGNSVIVGKEKEVFGFLCYNCRHYMLGLQFLIAKNVFEKMKKYGCLNCHSKTDMTIIDEYKIKIGKGQFKLKFEEYSREIREEIFKHMI
jgi:hypothetical protein